MIQIHPEVLEVLLARTLIEGQTMLYKDLSSKINRNTKEQQEHIKNKAKAIIQEFTNKN